MSTVEVYDSTLRDGAQAEGITYSLQDKLEIAQRLDDLGVHYIEGGWPNPTNPKDLAFFQEVKALDLRARVTAFGSTRRPANSAGEDATLDTLLKAGTDCVTLFGKSWDLHVTEVLKTTREENLRLIEDSVAYLVARGARGDIRRRALLRRLRRRRRLRPRYAARRRGAAGPGSSSSATPTEAPCRRRWRACTRRRPRP